MEAFGYNKKDSEFESILKLSQVTLCCTKAELDRLIAFLQTVKRESEEEEITEGDHWHYRDYVDDWTEAEADFIMFVEENISR